MISLPAPPAFSRVFREELRTTLHGLNLAWRVGAVLLLGVLGLFVGLEPSTGFLLPTPAAPPLVDFGILAALALAVVTWGPAGEHSPRAWAGIRQQPVDPRRRITARALAGSLWALAVGGVLALLAIVAPLVAGGGAVPGPALPVLGSAVVAFLFVSFCLGSPARVTIPALVVAVGIFTVFFLPEGVGGLRWLLLEGSIAPGAALLGTSLPAVLLWGGGLLVLLPRTMQLDRPVDSAPARTKIAPGRSNFRMHLGSFLGESRGRLVVGLALAAVVGGLLALETRGASLLLPLTWGMAFEMPFHFARGGSVFIVIVLLLGDTSRLAPSAFRQFGAPPVSRRRYLVGRGGALVALGLAGSLALHLVAGAVVLLFGGEPTSTTELAQTLWMVLMAGAVGVAVLTATERPFLLWIGLCLAVPLLFIALMLLADPLQEISGGWLPGSSEVAAYILLLRNLDIEGSWVPALTQLALVAGAAWYAIGPRHLRRGR